MRFVPVFLLSLSFLACAVRGADAPTPASIIHALTPEEFAKGRAE